MTSQNRKLNYTTRDEILISRTLAAIGQESQPGADPEFRRGVKLSRLLLLPAGPEKGVQGWVCG